MLQMPSGMEERAKAAPVFNLLLRENLTEELLMSQPTVFGPSAAVTMTNLALYGDSYVLTPLEFANQVNQATPNVYAFANQLAAPFVNSPMTTTAYVKMVLANMGMKCRRPDQRCGGLHGQRRSRQLGHRDVAAGPDPCPA
ncbi:MAG: hypothetical protein IPL15_09015 [Comamonadaceae bacterium]|uniref:hypothetical protein n=1 Tax=Candidatus Skiveiella danica TaxID=3386177 RepID=UPI00390B3F78|nr:hypothetical protein [Comamonadaceae bacterium]